MKNLLAGTLIPGVFALGGIAVLALWANTGPMVGNLQARVPGLDRPKPADGEPLRPRQLIGKLTQFDGKPADLPGSWPHFRGERFDGIGELGLLPLGEWDIVRFCNRKS